MIESRNLRWAGNITHMGVDGSVYTVLFGKREGVL
jgi:hypothetical protein